MSIKGRKFTFVSVCTAALVGLSLLVPGIIKNNNLNVVQPSIVKADINTGVDANGHVDESKMTDPATWKAVENIRNTWKKNDDKRDSGLPHDIPGVTRIDNLQYGKDPKWNSLDIYLPDNVHGKIPVIISIHGGGWVYGTKETYQHYGLGMAKRGFAFVNANYALGPAVKFPEELNEVNEYIHWIAKNADKYNLDKNNVFLEGDSAGGNMAEQYTAILTNPKYRKLFGYTLPKLKFRAVALNSPAVFMMDEPIQNTSLYYSVAYFSPQVMSKYKNQERLNAEKYITKKFLPTFITTANQDFLHDRAVRLDGLLRGRGVPVIQKSWGDENHPEGHVFLINQKDSLANEANDEEAAFFRSHIVNNSAEKSNKKTKTLKKISKKHGSKKRANKRHAKKNNKK